MRKYNGTYWRMAVTPDAIEDMLDLGVPDDTIDRLCRDFFSLGNLLSPERSDELQAIARPDCQGMFRWKNNPQLRGFVIKVREGGGSRRGTLFMTGVELRTPDTYEGGLTRQRDRIFR